MRSPPPHLHDATRTISQFGVRANVRFPPVPAIRPNGINADGLFWAGLADGMFDRAAFHERVRADPQGSKPALVDAPAENEKPAQSTFGDLAAK